MTVDKEPARKEQIGQKIASATQTIFMSMVVVIGSRKTNLRDDAKMVSQ
jgi:hypothetical protein